MRFWTNTYTAKIKPFINKVYIPSLQKCNSSMFTQKNTCVHEGFEHFKLQQFPDKLNVRYILFSDIVKWKGNIKG